MNLLLISFIVITFIIILYICARIIRLIRTDATIYIFNNQNKLFAVKITILSLLIFVAAITGFVYTSENLETQSRLRFVLDLALINNILIILLTTTLFYDIFRCAWCCLYTQKLSSLYYVIVPTTYLLIFLSFVGLIALEYIDNLKYIILGRLFFVCAPQVLVIFCHRIFTAYDPVSPLDKFIFLREGIYVESIFFYTAVFNLHIANSIMNADLIRDFLQMLGVYSIVIIYFIARITVSHIESKLVETIFQTQFTSKELELYNALKSGQPPSAELLETNPVTEQTFKDYKLSLVSSNIEFFSEEEKKLVEEYLRDVFFLSDAWRQIFYKDSDHYGLPICDRNYGIFMARVNWEKPWSSSLKKNYKKLKQRFGFYNKIPDEEDVKLLHPSKTSKEMKNLPQEDVIILEEE